MLENAHLTLSQGEDDPLAAYYDGIRNAPVPARLLAETPPEAFLRRLTVNLVWASAALVMVLLLTALPTSVDEAGANRAAPSLTLVAMRREALR